MSSLVSPEVCDFQGWQSYLLLLIFHHPPTISFQAWHNTMYILILPTFNHSFSAFTLGGRKGIRPVKTEWWGAGVVVCLEQGADLHMAQLMPLPLTVSCFSKIQIGFTFLVLAHLHSPGKRAGCVCVRACVCMSV